MAAETNEDMLNRLDLMASGDRKWDLSDNDRAAIRHALSAARRTQQAEAELAECREYHRACMVHFKATCDERDAALKRAEAAYVEGVKAAAKVAESDAARCVQEGSGSPSHALRIAKALRALAEEGRE